ncbi:DUF2399 domain-containing protein [Streptomyces sp. NPDC091371]|uniref:DUF2399 domain-containing protein n=1 Tax=Streptomyces sp. NPDC091371 TaxID=3155303 RepID=UPI003428A916
MRGTVSGSTARRAGAGSRRPSRSRRPLAASPWDPALSSALKASGQAVMEERLLPELLSDLG